MGRARLPPSRGVICFFGSAGASALPRGLVQRDECRRVDAEALVEV